MLLAVPLRSPCDPCLSITVTWPVPDVGVSSATHWCVTFKSLDALVKQVACYLVYAPASPRVGAFLFPRFMVKTYGNLVNLHPAEELDLELRQDPYPAEPPPVSNDNDPSPALGGAEPGTWSRLCLRVS